MQPEKRDLAYLWDMREAARDVIEFTAVQFVLVYTLREK